VIVSARRNDLGRVALTAAEVCRIAHREVPAEQRGTSLRVPLLNYAALTLMGLARQRPCDWTTIEGAASEAYVSWARLSPAATSRLAGVLVRSVDRLSDAVRKRKAGRLYAAARRLHHVAQIMA
jgi:hypothetical protein